MDTLNDPWVGVAIVLMAGLVTWFYVPRFTAWWREARKRTKQNKIVQKIMETGDIRFLHVWGESMRKRAADRVVSDSVCDLLEDMYYKKVITNRQKKYYDKLLSTIWPDLRSKPAGKRLKAQIADRVVELKTTPPANIPGPKPGEKTPRKRKAFSVIDGNAA